MKCRVLVADGHWLVRSGLKAALQQLDDHVVVGEAASAAEAIHCAHELTPDVALIDMLLPGGGGVTTLTAIKQKRHVQKVVLLSDHFDPNAVREALRAGCDGYLVKNGGSDQLQEAMRCVRSGTVYLDAEISRQMVLAEFCRKTPKADAHPLEGLSERERTVFGLIGAGLTNREAGESMQLSPKTVEKYRAALMQKLKLRGALELRLLALELGVAVEVAAPPSTSGKAPARSPS
jgi:DNA-binding NarL/FixJ family response regulator